MLIALGLIAGCTTPPRPTAAMATTTPTNSPSRAPQTTLTGRVADSVVTRLGTPGVQSGASRGRMERYASQLGASAAHWNVRRSIQRV